MANPTNYEKNIKFLADLYEVKEEDIETLLKDKKWASLPMPTREQFLRACRLNP